MKDIDIRYIKPNLSYSMDELAPLIEVQENTILSWVRLEGLRLIDEKMPFFVHGRELIRFIKHRQTKNRRPLRPGQCFCCKCRKPSTPIPGSAVLTKKPKAFHYTGSCGCGTRMSLIVKSTLVPYLKSLIASGMVNTGLTEPEVPHRSRYKIETETMIPINPENERIKHRYFIYETEVNGSNPKTIDKIRKGLIRFEQYTQWASFKTFDESKAIGFKKLLMTSGGTQG